MNCFTFKKGLFSSLTGFLLLIVSHFSYAQCPTSAVLAQAPVPLISENFDSGIPATWTIANRSATIGTTTWSGASLSTFAPYNGTNPSAAWVNFNSTTGANTISNWLILPNITLKNGDVFTFYTRTVPTAAYPDRLQVRMSASGTSTNVGTTSTDVGDFSTLLLDINPSLTTSGYPTTWTLYTVTISGLAAPTSGRLAFRYFVTDGGPLGANSELIAIDAVTYMGTQALVICQGDSATMTATISGGTAPYTVVYSNGATNTTVNNYLSGAEISISPTATSTYTLVSVTDSNNCPCPNNSGSVAITVNPIPSAAVLSGTTSGCSVNMSVNIIGGTSPYSVVYSNGAGNTTISNYASNSNITPAFNTTHNLVSVTDSNGCASTNNSGSFVSNTPNIVVKGNNTMIVDGSNYSIAGNHTYFGVVPIGDTATRTYFIKNAGTVSLSISGITLTGSSDFALTSVAPTTIAAGDSASFQITLTSSSNAVANAEVHIANNDCDANKADYTFPIRGNEDNLILYYNFEGTGTTLPNLAATPPAGAATATLMGGLTQSTGANICGNKSLVGTGAASSTDYVNTGWTTNLSGTSWTISFITKNISPSATLFYMFGDNTAASFRCFTNGVANANNWLLRGSFTDVPLPGGATVAQSLNTFVYDMAAGNIKAYLNGVLVNTVAQTTVAILGTGTLKVGGYNTNVGLPANGYMDEFRIYNKALTQAEILALLPPSLATLSGTAAICQNMDAQINVAIDNGISPYSVIYNDGTNNITQSNYVSGTNIAINPPSGTTTTYNLVNVIDANSCYSTSNTGTAAVTVSDTSEVTLAQYGGITSGTGATTITQACVGTPITLAATTAGPAVTSYQWQRNGIDLPGQTNDSLTVNSGWGVYRVRINNVNNCLVNADTFAISFRSLPNAQAGTDKNVCEGSSVTLGATNNASYTYTWSSNPSGFSSNVSNPAVTPSNNPTTYTVTVSQAVANSGGLVCTKSDEVVVNLLPLPTAPTIAVSAPASLVGSPNPSLCQGAGAISLAASGTSGATQLQWLKNGAQVTLTTNLANILNISNTAGVSASYTAKVKGTNACFSPPSNVINATINTAAQPTITPAGTNNIILLCFGANTSASQLLTANVTSGTPTYEWYQVGNPVSVGTGNTYNATITNSATSKTFNVKATYPNACVRTSANKVVRKGTSTCREAMSELEEEYLAEEMTAYPNPTSDKLKVSINHRLAQVGKLTLSNMLGQIVLTKELSLEAGNATEIVEMSSLPQGIYHLTFDTETTHQVVKVVKE